MVAVSSASNKVIGTFLHIKQEVYGVQISTSVLKCTELPISQNVDKSSEGRKDQKVANISNQNCSQEVVLQSLIVKLIGDNEHEQKVMAV
jgi:hypothetical protein